MIVNEPKTERDKDLVRDYCSGALRCELAEKFGISNERVRQILVKHNIKARPRKETIAIAVSKGLWRDCRNLGSDHPIRVKASMRQVEAVKLVNAGFSYSQIAKRLGVTRSTVAGLVFRHNQAHP